MIEPKKYHLERIADLLSVPVERREQCVKEILIGLAFSELSGAEIAGIFEWTDDGDMSSSLIDKHGDTMLKLEVRAAEQDSAETNAHHNQILTTSPN